MPAEKVCSNATVKDGSKYIIYYRNVHWFNPSFTKLGGGGGGKGGWNEIPSTLFEKISSPFQKMSSWVCLTISLNLVHSLHCMVKLNSLCCAKLQIRLNYFKSFNILFYLKTCLCHCNLFLCILYNTFSSVNANIVIFVCEKYVKLK